MGVLLASHPGADGFGSPGPGGDLEGSVSQPLRFIVTELQTHQQAKSQLQIPGEFQMD